MKTIPHVHRHEEIRRIRSDLERDSFPRLQMFLLVALTGASGFLTSYFLLHAGLDKMWLRYLASVGAAYLVFLGFLWLWLRTRAMDYADVPNVSTSSSEVGNSGICYSGKGGDFGGGGASGSYEAPSADIILKDASGPVGDTLGSVAEADELAIPLIVFVIIGAMVFSSLFLVYSAPALFAELLVDGVLAASLYRRLRGFKARHWLATALRRTAWPFALTAMIIAAAGWGMGLYAPGARSIGDVVFYAKQGS